MNWHFRSMGYLLASIFSGITIGWQPAMAGANLLVNGNFAEPGTGCAAGTTSLPGWTVTRGNIDIESTACSGLKSVLKNVYFLDLTGSFAESSANDVGAIAQTVTTVVGQKYILSFYFGGNPQAKELGYPNDSPLKVMTVHVDGAISGAYSVNTKSAVSTNPQWGYHFVEFIATTTNTSISFESLNGSATNPSDFGPTLADVKLEVAD